MRKARSWANKALLLAGVAGVAACSARATSNPAFDRAQCRRVVIADAQTGSAIRGAEDLALDPARKRLFISAYDRRAVEKAASSGAFQIPEGGIYAVDFAALVAAGSAPLPLTPYVGADGIPGGLRPHGLAYSPARDEVAFINRGYQKIDGKWRLSISIARVGGDGMAAGVAVPAHCGSNDLVEGRDGAYVTFDHEGCGWRATLEDAMTLRRSGVSAEDGAKLFDRAAFANGIVQADSGEWVLAATREKAALILREDGGKFVESGRVALPGGPDNLTVAADGDVVAAVHPSLIGMGLHRRLGLGRAGSRIVKFDPASRKIEVLFDDPGGVEFSAATVGVLWDGALVLGSATEEGLLVCRPQG